MNVEGSAVVSGSPEAKLKVHSGPMDGRIEGGGTLEVRTEEIGCKIGQIPVYVTIPFLKRAGGVVAVGAIGPFGAKLDPIQATMKAFGVSLNAALCENGFNFDVEGLGSGKVSVDVEAKIPPGFLKTVVKELVEE